MLGVFELIFLEVEDLGLFGDRVLNLHSHVVKVFVDDKLGDSSVLHREDCVLRTEADHVGSLCNLRVEFREKLLLSKELDVGEDTSGELNGLVEPILSSVGDIDEGENTLLKSIIEDLRLLNVSLEVG